MVTGTQTTTIKIDKQRYNGLLLLAVKEKRTAAGQLEHLLESAGIPKVADTDKRLMKVEVRAQ